MHFLSNDLEVINMIFKNKQREFRKQTLDMKYDGLISELQDVVGKQYSKYGVTLIKKNIHDSSIELYFNVGERELISMNINEKSYIEKD